MTEACIRRWTPGAILKMGLAVVGALFAQVALAATTTLTFDELATNTDISRQYQSLGITASGTTALLGKYTPWLANTAPIVIHDPTGVMSFGINSAVALNVKTVTAYVSQDTVVTANSFYSSEALLNTFTKSTGNAENLPISLDPTENHIARVEFNGPGAAYSVDTISFVPSDTVSTCMTYIQQLGPALRP